MINQELLLRRIRNAVGENQKNKKLEMNPISRMAQKSRMKLSISLV